MALLQDLARNSLAADGDGFRRWGTEGFELPAKNS